MSARIMSRAGRAALDVGDDAGAADADLKCDAQPLQL